MRDRSAARFVAITGSMGKTTTKDILAALCRPHARTVAAESSYNNEIGVPLTLCRLEPDTEVCVLELAMRGFGQIEWLCSFSRPQIGVVTSIGPVHLEKVGTIEGVRRAKSELIEALPARGDGDRARRLRGEPRRPRCRSDRRGRATRGLRAPGGRRRGRHLARRDRGQLHDAPPRRERGLRARRVPRARAAARAGGRGRLGDRVRRLAQPGAPASGRRAPDQRRVEREPGLDARGARAPSRARRRPPHGRRPRRDGRARRLRRGGPPRGRAPSSGRRRRRRRRSVPVGASRAPPGVTAPDRLEPGDCVLVKGARALALEGIADDWRRASARRPATACSRARALARLAARSASPTGARAGTSTAGGH